GAYRNENHGCSHGASVRFAGGDRMRRALVVVLFFGGLVGLWQLATMSGRWSPVLLPPPLAILDYLWGALRDGTLLEGTGVTLYRLLIGYLIGIVIGLPLGLLT